MLTLYGGACHSIASGEAEVRADDNDDGSAMVVNEAVYETVDFEALFKMRVSYLLDSLFASNPTLPTKIILVPAVTDVFHDYVFPQVGMTTTCSPPSPSAQVPTPSRACRHSSTSTSHSLTN